MNPQLQMQGQQRCSGSASNTGIVSLRKGEEVWVDLPDSYGLHNAPFHNYASFYGHLLFEEWWVVTEMIRGILDGWWVED